MGPRYLHLYMQPVQVNINPDCSRNRVHKQLEVGRQSDERRVGA